MKSFAAFLIALTGSYCAAQAQITNIVINYASGPSQTNQFRTTNGYGPNFGSLDGTPTNAPSAQQWQTTDPLVGDVGATSQLQYMEGWTALTSARGNKSVLFGGYAANGNVLPGIANPQLYYDFSSVVASPGDSASLTVDFSIIANPTVTFTNKDSFGFSLYDTNFNSLATFNFNPLAGSSTNSLRVEWVRNGTNVVTNGTTYRAFEINYGSLYRMTATVQGSSVSMSIGGLQTQSGGVGVGITNYALVTNVAVVTGGALSTGYTAADFERASIDWELASADPAAPGSNYMLMTSLGVMSQVVSSAIPEAGTWAAAILLCALAYGVRRRAVVSR